MLPHLSRLEKLNFTISSRTIAVGAISLTALLAGCGKRGIVPPPPTPAGLDLSTWLPLPNPQDKSFVGLAWTGTGGVDSDCYGMKDQIFTQSYDSVDYVWRSSDTNSVSLSIARLFGLKAEGTRAAGVILRLEGVKRVVASGLTPGGPECRNTKGNYPVKPAVEEALGARSLVYVAFDDKGKAIKDGKIDGSIANRLLKAGVDAKRSSSDSVYLSFASERWLAVRLVGFEEGKPDSSFTQDYAWGVEHNIPLQWRMRVDTTSTVGVYRVRLVKAIGGAKRIDTLLTNGDMIELQGSANAAAERTLANFWVLPQAEKFKLSLLTYRSTKRSFTSIDSAESWSKR